MSYTKLTATIPNLSEALTATLAQHRIDAPVHADLLAAGVVVKLETGDKVWLSCVVHDKPETPQVDFICVAIAGNGNALWQKPNGQYVSVAFWHPVWTQVLAELSVSTIRKALLLIAIGEAQPQVPIPNPEPGGPTEQGALPIATPSAHSIRTAIMAATEMAAPPADVL